MRVLITGASGFVGGAVARHLIQAGHDITCLVNQQTIDLSCSFVKGSLGTETFVQDIVSRCPPCDTIVHAAAKISYDNSELSMISTNIVGTQQLVELASMWKSRTFVYLSSIGVIGKPTHHPISEDHPVQPLSLYHATKLFGEQLILLQPDITSRIILRLTAPIGINMPEQRILPVFVRNAVQQLPLRLQGKGERQQNYVDVRDVARCINNSLSFSGSGIFNLGGRECISNLNLASMCTDQLDSKSAIEFSGTADPAEDEKWDVSISRAELLLHYRPEHDIRSSIQQLADYYAQQK